MMYRMDSAAIVEILVKDAGGTWFFLHVPTAVRQAWKDFENRGRIKVRVTIGTSVYDATMLPWADGSAQVSVGKKVRDQQGLREGDLVHATLIPLH